MNETIERIIYKKVSTLLCLSKDEFFFADIERVVITPCGTMDAFVTIHRNGTHERRVIKITEHELIQERSL